MSLSKKQIDDTGTTVKYGSEPETKEVFLKSPKPSPEDFVQAAKAEQVYYILGKEPILYLKVPLKDIELDSEVVFRVCKYEGVDKLPLMLSKHLKIPEKLGTYRVIEMLGRGAFTMVYLAEDTTSLIGHKVALKIPINRRGSVK